MGERRRGQAAAEEARREGSRLGAGKLGGRRAGPAQNVCPPPTHLWQEREERVLRGVDFVADELVLRLV